MKKQFKQIILILFLLLIYIIISAYSYVNAVSSDLKNTVFRLHIIANSDSKEDQDLKYLIRNNVLQYVNSISKDVSSKEELINLINSNINNIQTITQNTIYENGYSYDVSTEIGTFSFPTKFYGDITFPAGFYDALRIKIGNASGQNWWCVMFPPLCFIDVTSGVVPEDSKENLKNNLSDEEYNLLNNNKPLNLTLKFKIIEKLQNININLAKS